MYVVEMIGLVCCGGVWGVHIVFFFFERRSGKSGMWGGSGVEGGGLGRGGGGGGGKGKGGGVGVRGVGERETTVSKLLSSRYHIVARPYAS